MEKKLLLAFALSLIVLLGYPYLVHRIYGPPSPSPKETEPFGKQEIIETPGVQEPLPEVMPPQEIDIDEPMAPPIILETKKIILFFHPNDGSIREIYLKDYSDINGEPMQLVKVEGKANFIGLIGFQSPKYAPFSYEKVAQKPYELQFRASPGDGTLIEKKFELINDYALKFSLTFLNRTGKTLPLYYHLVAASGLHPEPAEKRFFEALAFSGGRKNFHLDKVIKGPVSTKEKTEWVALKEKYFSLVLKPERSASGYAITQIDEKKSMALRIWSAPQTIPPGGSVTEEYLFYFGPNKLQELKKLGPWAEGVINYGWFGGITKILLWALTSIHLIVKNYGLAIIILTILVSILLLPLSGLSYKSMKKMKLFQPEVNKIREMYKDKPKKMNKEMMALYKRNKVNPLGGCLPLLAQMPIFIAFYQALIYSIELKGAPFLFIKDLSMPDRAIPLPFQLGPLGNAINILPLLMMLAMYIQQKIATPAVSGGPEGETQRMMTTMMPFIFGFIFYGLPSGLVLYWLTNNVLMIVTQKIIFSKA